MNAKNNGRDVYPDIIDLPHHRSKKRRHMPMYDRAAQFSSFRALAGYEDMIDESSRLTEKRPELSEYEAELLDEAIGKIIVRTENREKPLITLTYFVPDLFKSGGSIQKICGRVKEVDTVFRCITLYGSENTDDQKTDPVVISFDDVIGIEEKQDP